jgi:cytochrome c
MTKILLSFSALSLCTVMGCTPASMPEADEGRAFYAANCTACHGQTGRGDGPTLLAADNGGTFPTARALAYVYGDAQQAHLARVMPQFGGAMADDLVPLDVEGTLTPTPRVLAALLSYLESIQEPT